MGAAKKKSTTNPQTRASMKDSFGPLHHTVHIVQQGGSKPHKASTLHIQDMKGKKMVKAQSTGILCLLAVKNRFLAVFSR
jgi:hypothetical protein